jgi:hypothetical protein
LKSHVPYLIAVAALALAAGLFATRGGVNLFMDSMWYLVYARSAQAGDGLTAPITSGFDPQTRMAINQWPPLYPLLLAAGRDLLGWARAVTVGLLALTALLTYALGVLVMDGRRLPALIAALLALASPTVSDVFASVYSETLFVPLALASLALLLRYRPGQPTPTGWALAAAGLAALAALTRYIGVAFIAAGGLYLVWWGRSVRQSGRWWPALAFALAALPIGLYLLYLQTATGSLTGAQTTTDMLELRDIPESLRVMALELLHGFTFGLRQAGLRSNWWGLTAGLIVAAGLAGLAWRQRVRLAALNDRHALLLWSGALYLGLFWLLAVRSGPVGPHDTRHFVVLYPLLLLLIVDTLRRLALNRALAAALIGLYLISGLAGLLGYGGADLNYNTARWRDDPLLADLPAHIPPSALVHGQDVGYLAFHLGDSVPVRMFGGDHAFHNYTCDELVYVDGYAYAAFTLMYSPMMRDQPAPQVEAFLRGWAQPCGVVERLEMTDFALLMVVRLSNEAQP